MDFTIVVAIGIIGLVFVYFCFHLICCCDPTDENDIDI